MDTFLIIYISGIITALWTYYHNLQRGHEITLSELFFVIIASLFSWFAFIVSIITIYGDVIVFKKK